MNDAKHRAVRHILLSASWLLPAAGRPPLADGGVLIADGRIAAAGFGNELRRRFPAAAERRYDDGMLLPGLINAHCHLEHTCLAHLCPDPGSRTDFIDWILTVIEAKKTLSPDQIAAGIAQGLDELAAAGTTTVGDHRSPAWFMHHLDNPEATRHGCPRQVQFLEIIAGDPARAAAETAAAGRRLAPFLGPGDGTEPAGGRLADSRPGLAPHAPYTVSLPLFTEIRKLATRHRLPVSFHLGESEAEGEFFRSGTGPIADRLYPRVGWKGRLPGGVGMDAVDWLLAHNAVGNLTAVHLATAHRRQLSRLAARGVVPVVCARSNRHLGNPLPDLEAMLALAPGPAMGTDSRASVPSLDPWAELRFLAGYYPTVSGDQLLAMGTTNGARALGLQDETGRLEAGYAADLLVIDGCGRKRPPDLKALIGEITAERVRVVLRDGKRIGGKDDQG